MKNRYYPQVTPLKVGKSLQRIDSLVLYLINVNFKKRGREREREREEGGGMLLIPLITEAQFCLPDGDYRHA